MPYYNQVPMNYYGASYWSPPSYAQAPMQSGVSYGGQPKVMEWVEGEVGAKAFQMPAGLPANQPIPLWDSTDTVIWMKSWNQFGAPNPMQKLYYTMPETPNVSKLPSGGGSQESGQSSYATKDDIQSLRDEIRTMLNNNQNGRYSKDSRGEQNGKSSV